MFNALTKNNVLAANYPFATIEPNVGVVPLSDPRLNVLATIFKSEKILPATPDSANRNRQDLRNLARELARAKIVPPERIPPDVVTMNSRVSLRLDDEAMELALVYPQAADEAAGRLSVLSDLGAAILGYREGGAVDRMVSDRPRRIVIDRVIYQPEASGDFHL